MNGLAVLLCAAALGVEHNWRTTEEGQLEYVLQVEPTFLTSLQQGQAVTSKLPSTAKEVHRLCLRIASGDVRKAPQRAPELPPLATAQERAAQVEPDIPVAVITDAKGEAAQTTDVSHGWQPVSRERVEYVVQLAPELVSQLREGDEILMNVYPEAGQIQQFTIVAGQEVLPRKAARAPATTLASKQPKTIAPAAGESSSVYGPTAGEAAPTRTATSRTNEIPRLRSPQKFKIADQTVEDPAAEELAAAAPYRPALDNRGAEPAPELFSAEPPAEEAAEPVYGPLRSPASREAADVPIFDKNDNDQFANVPVNRPKNSRPAIAPPDDDKEYVPIEEMRLTEPRNSFAGLEKDAEGAGEEERTGLDNNRTASLENGKPRKGLSNASTKAAKASTAAAGDNDPKTPWLPLVLTGCALFFSLGGNVYLGWTAAEFYSRYRLAIERMRTSNRDEVRD
jgi:hypothetical protein